MKNSLIIKSILVVVLLGVFISYLPDIFVLSQETSELEQKLEETEAQKQIKEKILNETQAEINSILNSSWSLTKKISALEDQITRIERDVRNLQLEIIDKEENIKVHTEQIEEKVEQVESISRRLYINSRVNMLDMFVSTDVSNNLLRSYILKKYTMTHQLDTVHSLNGELGDLQEKKVLLDEQRTVLEAENEALDESRSVLATEKERLNAEIAARSNARGRLQKEIALLNDQITKLQESILLARSGSFVPSVGSVPSGADYYASAEAFRKEAPKGSFAVFSFGAYTHRNGMSQWGAKARADAGQNVNQILSFYYPGGVMRSGTVVINGVQEDIMQTISVEGQNERVSFEDLYLLGIKEVPESWPMEILKAQAIAARTYAIRRTNNGRSTICVTQSCQVFSLPVKSGRWVEAVNSTRGMILANSNGTPSVTQYAAVHGGWVTGVGWDTTNGVGGGNWTERAHESISRSPWFYKSWYRNGIRDNSPFCFKDKPWLSTEEMSDLLNTWLVMKRMGVKGSVDDSRILPISVVNCSYSGLSGNPYSMGEMRGLLNEPVTEIYGTPQSVLNNNGQTTSVTFSTNRGTISIPGLEFKAVYNTRAPGFLSIPQPSWAFINIERSL